MIRQAALRCKVTPGSLFCELHKNTGDVFSRPGSCVSCPSRTHVPRRQCSCVSFPSATHVPHNQRRLGCSNLSHCLMFVSVMPWSGTRPCRMPTPARSTTASARPHPPRLPPPRPLPQATALVPHPCPAPLPRAPPVAAAPGEGPVVGHRDRSAADSAPAPGQPRHRSSPVAAPAGVLPVAAPVAPVARQGPRAGAPMAPQGRRGVGRPLHQAWVPSRPMGAPTGTATRGPRHPGDLQRRPPVAQVTIWSCSVTVAVPFFLIHRFHSISFTRAQGT